MTSTFLTVEATWENPSEETLKAWAEVLPDPCVECAGPITVGEYDASGICSTCYFTILETK